MDKIDYLENQKQLLNEMIEFVPKDKRDSFLHLFIKYRTTVHSAYMVARIEDEIRHLQKNITPTLPPDSAA